MTGVREQYTSRRWFESGGRHSVTFANHRLGSSRRQQTTLARIVRVA
jgi:hypothetical protein